jgi:hypothetical protein
MRSAVVNFNITFDELKHTGTIQSKANVSRSTQTTFDPTKQMEPTKGSVQKLAAVSLFNISESLVRWLVHALFKEAESTQVLMR